MKYEKFDVVRALAGEPVILRDGRKAYVRHHETELEVEHRTLVGLIDGGSEVVLCDWKLSGLRINSKGEQPSDIIGMYPKELLTMPDSFWSIVRADITAIAKDRNGSWFAYINCKPRTGTRGWIISTGEYVPLTAFPLTLFPDCAWEDSLILRPGQGG